LTIPPAVTSDCLTSDFAINDEIIAGVMFGRGESATVEVVVAARVEDVDCDNDDATVVGVVIVGVVVVGVVVVVVVVVVVEVATLAKPFSATVIIRSPDSLSPIPLHPLAAGASIVHVAPWFRDTKSLSP
jgi:hypothetical protein